jgi:ArsR family transcriptional regulator
MKIEDVAARLEALGHPTRLRLFRILVRAGAPGMPVGQLQERLEIAPSTLSHHLSKLVAVGLIVRERQATSLICRAEFERMRELVGALEDECCIEQAPAAGSRGVAPRRSLN